MVPVGLTLGAMLGDAATVVAEFDTLIILVGGLTLGIFAVKFLISNIKRARG